MSAVQGYVGSKACESCHRKEYDGWENTLHSTMVQHVKGNPLVILGDFTDPVAKQYSDKYEISHTIGTHWQQRYMTKIKDDYYVFPITWSIITSSWDEISSAKKFMWKRQPYSKKCIGCHTTNFNPEDGSYSEHRIGCESCHGPGNLHISYDGRASLIVNPAKLPDNLRDMVCAACHVKAQDKTEQYTFPIGFKPGENLADYLSISTILRDESESAEAVILRVFEDWKVKRKAPKSCDVCGIDRPNNIPTHLIDQAAESPDFCLSCHDFKDKLKEHTRHTQGMVCNDCHKVMKNSQKISEERNIHSYEYYMIHKKGCYDPYIEKSCIKCHKDKTRDWATSYVIDWSVPPDFNVHDE